MPKDTLVELSRVTKSYPAGEITIDVLRGVDLILRRDELVVVHGVSGCGKTTLLNLIGALDVPSSGDVVVDGALISGMTERARARFRAAKVGFVFQFYNLWPTLTAGENVEAALEVLPMTRAEIQSRAYGYLSAVGLGDKATKFPSQLSGGQQQRVAIARALINEPVLILADEPTGNLDSRTSVEIMAVFQELNRSGITIVLVTHEADIADHARRVLSFRDGKLIADKLVGEPTDARRLLATLPPPEVAA